MSDKWDKKEDNIRITKFVNGRMVSDKSGWVKYKGDNEIIFGYDKDKGTNNHGHAWGGKKTKPGIRMPK